LFVGLAIVEDVNARAYRSRFVIDESGVMEYSDAPLRQQERNKKGPVVAGAKASLPALPGSGWRPSSGSSKMKE